MKKFFAVLGLTAASLSFIAAPAFGIEKNALAEAREKCCKRFGWHYSLSEGTEINGGICYPESMDVKLDQARAFNECLQEHGQKGDPMLDENWKPKP